MPYQIEEQVLLQAGRYLASIAKVTRETGQYGAQFKWTFDVDGGGQLAAWSSAENEAGAITSGMKTSKWVRAVLGSVSAFDPKELVGQPCVIVVKAEERDDGSQYNKIDNVLPVDAPNVRSVTGEAPAHRQRIDGPPVVRTLADPAGRTVGDEEAEDDGDSPFHDQ